MPVFENVLYLFLRTVIAQKLFYIKKSQEILSLVQLTMQVCMNIGRSVEEEGRECVVEKGSCAQLWKKIGSQQDLQERNELTPPKQL